MFKIFASLLSLFVLTVTLSLSLNASAQADQEAMADFNHDTMSQASGNTFSGSFVATVTGNPEADHCNVLSFDYPRNTPPVQGRWVEGVATADFNNDGHLDIAANETDNVCNGGFGGRIHVYLGDGAGNYTSDNALEWENCQAMGNVIAADLNNDGKIDIVGTGGEGSSLQAYLGDGLGGFSASHDSFFGSERWNDRLVYGDFDGDGKVDLISRHESTNMYLHRGLGDGYFAAPQFIPSSVVQGRSYIKVVDLNGDGKPDLLFTNGGATSTSYNITVLYGNGDGTFGNSQGGDTGNPVDFNFDGKVDRIFAGLVGLRLELGDGSGHFDQVHADHPSGADRYSVDLNGDGFYDVMTFENAGNNNNDSFYPYYEVYLGQANGDFSPPIRFRNWGDTYSCIFGDVNEDGRPDLIFGYLGRDLSILLNEGVDDHHGPRIDGADDTSASSIGPEGVPVSFNVSSRDNSGFSSLVVCDHESGNTFPIGTTTVTCTAADYCGNSHSQSFNITVVDQPPVLSLPNGVFAGDSCPTGKVVHYTATASDAVSGNLPVSCNPASGTTFPIGQTTVTCSATDGAGHTSTGTFNVSVLTEPVASFDAPRHFSNGSTTVRTATADFNNDGNLDIAATAHDASYVGVFLGDGTGDFSGPAVLPAGGFSVPVSTGDFNHDGNQDLVVGSNDGTVWIYLGDGTGSFGAAAQYADGDGEAYEMAVADFNGDGNLDLAVGHQFGGLAIMLGDGSGAFSMVSTYIPESGPVKVAPADFNNDGKLDLITANASGNSSLLLGDGAGGFGVSDLSIPATEWGPSNSGFAIGDFDHDGNMDFGTSRDPNSIEVYYGDGHGGFQSTRIFAGSSNKDPHAVDFNGDGKLDIVATGHPDPVASVMLGDGSGGFGSAMNFAVGDGPQGSSIADFNNDGKPDIVTPNYFGGDITVMLNTTEAASGSACDQISPSTAASPSLTPNVAGWNNSNVNIALNAVDNTGGSGVKNITYSSSGAQNIPPTTVTGSIASVGIIAEGQTTISYVASDNAGNVESSHNVTVRIDKTAPAISCGSADGSWHAANVSIACSASDPMSGLTVSGDAGFSLSTSVTAGIETSNAATGSHPVCDKAGNCSTAGPIGGNKIDRKDPLITITTPVTGTYFYQQLVNVGYGCSDGGSGVLGCTGTAANGGLLNTSSYGSKTFTVNSTDKVGNSSLSVVNYNVVYHVPANKDQCKNGGWQTLQRPDGTLFKNQGDCVSFVNTGH